MVTMDRLREIWPTIRALADDLGEPYPTVQAWAHRGVPAKRYAQIIRAARKRGHDLTFEELAGLAPPRKGEDAA